MKDIRLVLGVLLPVPLFVILYYGYHYYLSYHGFNHETKQYVLDDLTASRIHAKTEFLFLNIFGYICMLIPSIIFSVIIERQRSKAILNKKHYLGLGAFLGFIASFVFLLVAGIYTSGSSEQILKAILASTLAGFVCAQLLLGIKNSDQSSP